MRTFISITTALIVGFVLGLQPAQKLEARKDAQPCALGECQDTGKCACVVCNCVADPVDTAKFETVRPAWIADKTQGIGYYINGKQVGWLDRDKQYWSYDEATDAFTKSDLIPLEARAGGSGTGPFRGARGSESTKSVERTRTVYRGQESNGCSNGVCPIQSGQPVSGAYQQRLRVSSCSSCR